MLSDSWDVPQKHHAVQNALTWGHHWNKSHCPDFQCLFFARHDLQLLWVEATLWKEQGIVITY
jgi:hypothetical protein